MRLLGRATTPPLPGRVVVTVTRVGMSTRVIARTVEVSQSTVRRAIAATSNDRPDYVRGLDGKVYPVRWLCEADQRSLVSLVHHLRHAENWSLRKIQAVLADEYGVRRSVGWVAGVFAGWRCEHCSAAPDESPEQFVGRCSS